MKKLKKFNNTVQHWFLRVEKSLLVTYFNYSAVISFILGNLLMKASVYFFLYSFCFGRINCVNFLNYMLPENKKGTTKIALIFF
ncbi:hypothetical protein ES703_35739 [subsurface metagenome]